MADVPSLRLFKEKINELIGKDTELDKKITDGDNALGRRIDGKLGKSETAYGAYRDGSGYTISSRYATKDELRASQIRITDLVVKATDYIRDEGNSFYVRTAKWTVSGLPSGTGGTLNLITKGSVFFSESLPYDILSGGFVDMRHYTGRYPAGGVTCRIELNNGLSYSGTMDITADYL